QGGDWMVPVHALDRGEMDKGAVVELQYHVARVVQRFSLEFLEHPLDQAHVVRHLLWLDLVAYQSPFHPTAPLIVARMLSTFGTCRRIRSGLDFFRESF